MNTVFLIAGAVLIVLVVVGILGSIFRFASGLIKTAFSLAALAGLVLLAIWFFNGQQLPF